MGGKVNGETGRGSGAGRGWDDDTSMVLSTDRNAWEINLKSMVIKTRLKPGPTKARRYGGRPRIT